MLGQVPEVNWHVPTSQPSPFLYGRVINVQGECEQQPIFPVTSTGKYSALNSVFLSPISVLCPAMSISYSKVCARVQVCTHTAEDQILKSGLGHSPL